MKRILLTAGIATVTIGVVMMAKNKKKNQKKIIDIEIDGRKISEAVLNSTRDTRV